MNGFELCENSEQQKIPLELNLPMLHLTVWRLSSDSPVRPASLLQWLENFPSFDGSPHA